MIMEVAAVAQQQLHDHDRHWVEADGHGGAAVAFGWRLRSSMGEGS
jgi:hypothetical protein